MKVADLTKRDLIMTSWVYAAAMKLANMVMKIADLMMRRSDSMMRGSDLMMRDLVVMS